TASAIAARDTGATVALVGAPRSAIPGTLELLATDAHDTLTGLGFHDLVRSNSEPCVGVVSRWFTDEFVEHSSLLEPRGGGWIVDGAVLDLLLVTEATARGVRVIADRAIAVETEDDTRSVSVRTRRESLVADVAVVAVGRGAAVVRGCTERALRHRVVALGVT